jgi:hypothetical protein
MRGRPLLIFCLAAVAWGQTPGRGPADQRTTASPAGQRTTAATAAQDPTQFCKLEGSTVSAATGEPLPRASLTLAGSGQNAVARSARSDSDGRFLIENVPAGTYRLTAERVGFLRQGYGSRTPGGSGAPLILAPKQHLKDLLIRLTPQGVILGTVLDEEGDPVPRASVTASRLGGLGVARASGGRGVVLMGTQSSGGTASTNDIGEYRLAGLIPGRYIVTATSQGRGGAGRGSAAGFPGGFPGAAAQSNDAPEEAYLPTYYPSTIDPTGAVPIETAAGQEIGGITIVLQKGSLYSVQGKIVGGTPQDLASVRISLTQRERGAFMPMGRSGGMVGSDGTFELSGVQPGSYYVIAQRMGRQGAGIAGRATVDVARSDVTGVVLALSEPMTVSGTVRMEGEQKTALQRLMVLLASIDGLSTGVSNGRVSETGAFKLDSVAADSYYVTFSGLPEGAYVKSVRLANQEVIDKGIDLTSSRAGVSLDVVLSSKAGAIEGVVTADDKPAAGSFVAILADPIRPAQPYLNKFATTDQDGKFSIKGVAPGDYKLYSWEESQAELRQQPELAKPFEHKAVKVSVEESGAERAELKILKPEDAQGQ